MKIAIVSHVLSGLGGTEEVLKLWLTDINREHAISLFMPGEEPNPDWAKNLPVFRGHIFKWGKKLQWRGKLPLYLLWFQRIIQQNKPDIVICVQPIWCRWAYFLRKLRNTSRFTIVSYLHNSLSHEVGIEHLRYADAHLCIAPSMAQQIDEISSAPKYVINNPLRQHFDDFRIIPRSESNHPRQLLYVGRLQIKQKKVDFLLKNLANLKHLSWELTVIGDGVDRQFLQDLAVSYQIAEKIHWKGWLKDPWEEISSADLLILTSDYEGFPLTIIEALAHGIPVLSSNPPTGPRDIIRDGQNGWLFPVNDDDKFTAILNGIVTDKVSIPETHRVRATAQSYDRLMVVQNILNALRDVTH